MSIRRRGWVGVCPGQSQANTLTVQRPINAWLCVLAQKKEKKKKLKANNVKVT